MAASILEGKKNAIHGECTRSGDGGDTDKPAKKGFDMRDIEATALKAENDSQVAQEPALEAEKGAIAAEKQALEAPKQLQAVKEEEQADILSEF